MYITGKYTIKCQTCGKTKEVCHSGLKTKFCSRTCRRQTAETKEMIRETKTGVAVHSDEHKQVLRERMAGNEHALGHTLSDEHKQAIADAQTGSKSHFWKDGRCQDPAYISWISNRWHHRKRNAEGKHTYKEWQEMKKSYKFTCPMCLRIEPEIQLTEDHIIPLSKDGRDDIENIQPLCLKCNMRKHTKLIPKLQLVT